MPYKVWVAGEEVLAADFNDYVQEQVLAVFPNAAARATALPAPNVGQQSFLVDVLRLEVWTGTAWGAPTNRPAGLLAAPQYRVVNRTCATSPVSLAATGSPISVTLPAARAVRFHVEIPMLSVTAGAPQFIQVWAYVDGVAHGLMFNNDFLTSGTRMAVSASHEIQNLAAGVHTFDAVFFASGGTGQATLTAAGTNPGPLVQYLEDIGPAL